jgi:hypothetical protein
LAAAPWLSGWWPVGGLTVIVVIESVAWFPNYLAYFNGLVRPSQAYRHLVDSSLDWGQDLPAAKRYIATHPATPPCFLVYFGVDSPRRHGIRARQVYGYPNVEGDQDPLFKLLEGIPPEQRTAPLRKFFSENPDYDPNFLARLETPPSFVALKRASALRLEAGTYLVSASLVQTVFYHHAYKPWDDEMEKLYQALKKDVQPLFMEDAKARAATVAGQRIEVWRDLFASFQEFRFARLAAYLRRREPDDTINYSILVYRLSQAEIDAAENGAAPFEMKTQVK